MKQLFIAALFFMTAATTVHAQDDAATTKDPKFIVTGNLNYAYRLAKIDKSYTGIQREYLKNLKSGVSYDISAYYMINRELGFGLKFNSFNSSEGLNGVYVSAPNGETGYGNISDEITISFFGIGEIYKFGRSGSRHSGLLEAALGYMRYKNDAFAIDNYTLTGGTFGSAISVAYQYEAFKNFSVGPKFALLGGSIRKYDIEGPDGFKDRLTLGRDNQESLLRMDLGIVASYRF